MEAQTNQIPKAAIKAAAKAYVHEDPVEYRLWKLTPGTIKTIKEHYKAGVKWAVENYKLLAQSELGIKNAAQAYAISELGERLFHQKDHEGHAKAIMQDFTRAVHWALDQLEEVVS